jgi:cystathionine gamma-synthase
MAAEATVLALFNPGETVLVHNDLYGGTWRLFTSVLAPKGIQADFIALRDLEPVRNSITPSTRAIWIETPTNPLMNLADLAAVAVIAREAGVLTICDNTFLSPYFHRQLDLGTDVVIHSTTKYISGHSDVVGGAAIVTRADLADKRACPRAMARNASESRLRSPSRPLLTPAPQPRKAADVRLRRDLFLPPARKP